MASAIDDHREDLEDLADSNLPCSEIAQHLLTLADDAAQINGGEP